MRLLNRAAVRPTRFTIWCDDPDALNFCFNVRALATGRFSKSESSRPEGIATEGDLGSCGAISQRTPRPQDDWADATASEWMWRRGGRYEPNDSPQIQIVAFLRSLFGDQVLTHPIVKSTAVSDARLTKQTLYEAGQRIFPAGHTIARWKPSTRSIMKSKS